MLGASIADPDGVEEGGYMRGMELLPIDTVLKDSKTRLQTSGEIAHVDGVLNRLSGCHFLGYEIHMGKSAYSTASEEQGACADRKNELNNVISDGRNVYGSYIHGIFDTADEVAATIRSAFSSVSSNASRHHKHRPPSSGAAGSRLKPASARLSPANR